MEATKDMILLVDDNVANLKIGKNTVGDMYDVSTAPSAEKMFKLLEWDTPSLILLDVDMPVMNGYEALEILRKNPKTRDIPVIFLTAKSDSENEIKGLRNGAVDYISKPFLPELLRVRVENHLTIVRQKKLLQKQSEELKQFNENLQRLVNEKVEHIIKLHNSILKNVSGLIEEHGEKDGRAERTQKWMNILMDSVLELGLYPEETKNWDKTGTTNPPQSAVTTDTMDLGTKLSGASDIPLSVRLMAIADIYDALTSEKVYKPAFSHENAVKIIAESSGMQFDPSLVQVLVHAQNRINNERGG